jgi:hypothetical protein
MVANRLKIWSELDELRISMDSNEDTSLGDADFQRIALTVAYAVVNPSKQI